MIFRRTLRVAHCEQARWVFKETYVFAVATTSLLAKFHLIVDEDWFEDLPIPQKLVQYGLGDSMKRSLTQKASLKDIQRSAIKRVHGTVENMPDYKDYEDYEESFLDSLDSLPDQQTCLYALVLLKKLLDGASKLQLRPVPESYDEEHRVDGLYEHHIKMHGELRDLRRAFKGNAWINGKPAQEGGQLSVWDHRQYADIMRRIFWDISEMTI
ncbi:hypothetical protein HYALB_00008524 [Hymenoscyphus albidus]|uniref:Uncharacterized protein n=1 Tax=Hymenoscyphus albidus TaxID=595503 RepID=A0A9N9LJ43_9HELO|nr:hypothetical protein HYALB_00008524 [Hymenoscyphus albidus]